MEKDILILAKKLIAIESINLKPQNLKDVLEVAKQELEGISYKSFEKDNYSSLLFSNKGFDQKFKLILNAHVDVVPAKPEQFVPEEKDNKLYGRGSADMKTAAATMLLVFKELYNKVDYPLGLQLVTDEELGGYNGTKYQLEQGVRCDFVIAGEMTNLTVCNETKGVIQVKITLPGIAAHSAYQWQGKNAINQMSNLIQKIKEAFPELTEEIWRTTANIATIQTSNTAANKVPHDCSIILDIRYISNELEFVEKKLHEIMPDDAIIEYIEKEPAQHTKADNFYLIKFLNSAESILGTKPDIIRKHGASDIRSFNAIGCDGIQFGPSGYGMHTDDEYIEIDSLQPYYEVLQKYITNLNNF